MTTKPTTPAPAPAPESDEIEMDAMDLEEWERDQRTPQAPDAKLTELVKQSAAAPDEPKRPPQTLARVLHKQQRETKAGGPPPTPGPFDSATVRNPPRVETATVPAPTQTMTPVAPNVVARTITSARTATPPAGTPVSPPPPTLPRTTTHAAAKSAPTRATPPAGIPRAPVIEDSEGWALPDDADDADWSSLAAAPARGGATPAPKASVAATTPVRGDATPAPKASVAATTPVRGDATPAPKASVAATTPAPSPPSSATQGLPVIARTQTQPVRIATIPRAGEPVAPRTTTQAQPVLREEGTPRPGPPPAPRTKTQAQPVLREEGTPRPGPPPAPRTTTQAQPVIARTKTPPAGVPAPETREAPSAASSAVTPVGGVVAQPPSVASSAVTPVGGVVAQPPSVASSPMTPVGGVAALTPPGGVDAASATATARSLHRAITADGDEAARTSMIGQPGGPLSSTVTDGAGPSSVSLEALAAAAEAEDVPELEPSQSADDLAIPMASPETSVVIAKEISEPVRLPEAPQAAAPLPPPPRPRTEPVPVVLAPSMVPEAPVLPSTRPVPVISAPSMVSQAPVLPPPRAPGAVGTQPLPPMQAAPAPAFEPSRDERWNQTDSLPIVRPAVSRKLIAIIGGAVALVTIVVIVMATRGPDKETRDKPVIAKHDPVPNGSAAEGSDMAGSAETQEAGSGSASDPDPTGKTPTGNTPTGNTPTGRTPTGRTPTGNTPTGRTPTGRTPTTIGKTTKTPNETGPAKGPSAETLAAARTSYETGNSKLFSGDVDGAISAYKQTLALYPGYAAGYRGLGLAYAQQGNKAKALQALRQYVSAAPNARDADIIRKRIAALAGS